MDVSPAEPYPGTPDPEPEAPGSGARFGVDVAEPGLVSDDRDLDPVAAVQLREDLRHVRLHGRLAHEQPHPDLGARQPCPDRAAHPALAARELIQTGVPHRAGG